MRQLSRFKALKMIHDTNGKIFAAQFIKKDGSTRKMIARIGVSVESLTMLDSKASGESAAPGATEVPQAPQLEEDDEIPF